MIRIERFLRWLRGKAPKTAKPAGYIKPGIGPARQTNARRKAYISQCFQRFELDQDLDTLREDILKWHGYADGREIVSHG